MTELQSHVVCKKCHIPLTHKQAFSGEPFVCRCGSVDVKLVSSEECFVHDLHELCSGIDYHLDGTKTECECNCHDNPPKVYTDKQALQIVQRMYPTIIREFDDHEDVFV